VRWQRRHGRHDLPWQRDRDPYRVWVSEVMLQQTQVATVIGYYDRFLERFPTVTALAEADEDDVLAARSGLGYYSRARHLQRAARQVNAAGWPTDAAGLAALPGIGPSTAAAIATFCFGQREPILDGNVRRVYGRYLGPLPGGATASGPAATRLWIFARAVMADPALADDEAPAFIQGLMDLGAQVCTRSRPRCDRCPLAAGCRLHADAGLAAPPTATAGAAVGVVARRRPALPSREYRLLLIRQRSDADDGGIVWLQRRAPTGLWGGLWSLPEIGAPRMGPETGAEDGVVDTCRDGCGSGAGPRCADGGAAVVDAVRTLAAAAGWVLADAVLDAARRPVEQFDHVFTHFRMRALIHRIDLSDPTTSAAALPSSRVDDVGSPWVSLPLGDRDAIGAAPLATPIRRLLLRQSPAGED
jgi:A/G-specific adenine glycosylase